MQIPVTCPSNTSTRKKVGRRDLNCTNLANQNDSQHFTLYTMYIYFITLFTMYFVSNCSENCVFKTRSYFDYWTYIVIISSIELRRTFYPQPSEICDALRNLVAFVQFKKREQHPWRSVNTPPWVLFTFFKLYKWYQIAQRTTYFMLCSARFNFRSSAVFDLCQ